MKTATQPPGPVSKFPGDILLALHRDPLGFMTELAGTYGDVVHFRVGFHDAYLINHPDLIQEVWVSHSRDLVLGIPQRLFRLVLGDGLITSEGQMHLEQRRQIQPAFHRNHIAALGEISTTSAARWCAEKREGDSVDISRDFGSLTLNLVAQQLFGISVERQVQALLDMMERYAALASPTMVYLAEVLVRLPLPITQFVKHARARLNSTIDQVISDHRAREGRGDVLSIIMDSKKANGTGSVDEARLRDQIITLLVAGHVSTALALMWTFYLLSQHPEVEARLHAEIDSVLGERLATVDELRLLPYTRRVLIEVMRLYPPIWGMDRKVAREFRVGEYVFLRDALVIVSQWITHRDSRFFPDPARFDPERWTPNAVLGRPKLSYLPFGAGPRICVGEDLAWMNEMLVLVTFARRWRMRPVPGQRIELVPRAGLGSKYGMRMELQRRWRTL